MNVSQSKVNGKEVFYAAISGQVICISGLPMSVTEASITSRVVAKNTVNGAVLILNQGCTITIKPFPSRTGQIADISQNVSRRLPDAAPNGDYNVVDEVIEAKIKVAFIWAPVTDYFLNRCLLAR